MATKKSYKKLADNFRILEKGFKASTNVCCKELADALQKEVEFNHAVFVATLPPNDPQDHDITVYQEYASDGNRIMVRIAGDQVIYDEFGTGDLGERNPHPDKNKYNLNDYNSGEHIKVDKYGRHYWFYKKQITNGVPSGKFIYKSMNNLRGVAPDIIKKKLKETWSDLL